MKKTVVLLFLFLAILFCVYGSDDLITVLNGEIESVFGIDLFLSEDVFISTVGNLQTCGVNGFGNNYYAECTPKNSSFDCYVFVVSPSFGFVGDAIAEKYYQNGNEAKKVSDFKSIQESISLVLGRPLNSSPSQVTWQNDNHIVSLSTGTNTVTLIIQSYVSRFFNSERNQFKSLFGIPYNEGRIKSDTIGYEFLSSNGNENEYEVLPRVPDGRLYRYFVYYDQGLLDTISGTSCTMDNVDTLLAVFDGLVKDIGNLGYQTVKKSEFYSAIESGESTSNLLKKIEKGSEVSVLFTPPVSDGVQVPSYGVYISISVLSNTKAYILVSFIGIGPWIDAWGILSI